MISQNFMTGFSSMCKLFLDYINQTLSLTTEQERNLFLHKFLENLQMNLSKSLPGVSITSDAPKAANVCSNLRNYRSPFFFTWM